MIMMNEDVFSRVGESAYVNLVTKQTYTFTDGRGTEAHN